MFRRILEEGRIRPISLAIKIGWGLMAVFGTLALVMFAFALWWHSWPLAHGGILLLLLFAVVNVWNKADMRGWLNKEAGQDR